ncbi:MAG TPA: putative peptide maturation dehydrogenase [Gaiellaceae bacterium]|nr:putative peptide maturation dehydrogenase [Gaiellaceae bacterium]
MLNGEELPLEDDHLRLLLAIPADHWIRADEAGGADTVRELALRGLVVSDDADEQLAELRRRDEQLASPAWNRYAALYHSMTRWSDVRAVVAGEAPLPQASERWPPPPHFHTLSEPLSIEPLPLAKPTRPFFELLLKRKTTRGFDPDASLSLEELSTILRYVWGCHGALEVRDELTILKKTSPSGGSQHPVEVYPLVRSVDGLQPGFYHYAVENHELELVEPHTGEEVAELILEVTAGQAHFVGAQALFLMTARFSRNFWKYAAHAKAYRVLLLDAAHLSQTLYLVCAELGLGAFVSAAINEHNIDRHLRLQPFTEGAILVSGCGRPAPSDREPQYRPHTPRPGLAG